MNENNISYKNKMYPFFVFIALILSLYLATLARNEWKEYRYIGKSDEFPYTLSISGKGRVFALPDIASVSLGLKIEKKTVSLAQEENTKKMNQLNFELKKINIAKEDISTTQYTVYPVYDWTDGKQTLRAYSVDQNATIKIRDFENIPKVLQLIGILELNQVGGLQFIVDDIEKFEQQARVLAIKDAKSKAEILAKEAGIKLGKIISFNENGAPPPPIPYYKEIRGFTDGAGGDLSYPPIVEGGNQEITIQIHITYEVL